MRADRTAYIQRPAPNLWLWKECDFPEWLRPIHAIVTLLYRTLQSTLRYGHTWMTAAGSKFLFKIAAKSLQIKTEWLLLNAYKNWSSPYLMVTSPTPYVVRYGTVWPQYVRYSGQMDSRQTTHRTQGSTEWSAKK